MTSVIAIVGRPNVGKSTLFNRLLRSRGALVDNVPGITRDRLYGDAHWKGIPFTVIDTAGFDDADKAPLLDQVKTQVIKAIDEADRIIFMVDGKQGIMPADEEITDILRRTRKKVFLAVNKVDGPENDGMIIDFYSMGIGEAYPVSAAHGYGLKTFMEKVITCLPEYKPEREDEHRIRVSIVGRPNVGKSSLINRILGDNRLLVSELPGTTRDSVDILFHEKGKEYLLIDTAGIRRRGKVREKIEKFSMIKAIQSLGRCHIAVILLDAAAGISDQDTRILGYALERGRGVILAVNKWDLVRKDTQKKKYIDQEIKRRLKFIPFAPRVNLSALTGERVGMLFEKIDLLHDQFCRRINTGPINRAIQEMARINPPPRIGKKGLKFFYATQTTIKPPTFVVFVNRPDQIHFSYKRFMTNQLKESLGLDLTPIRLLFRKK